jgi:phosphocarrier protein FPr/phosphocarrier protein
VAANIKNAQDAVQAVAAGADGVGLMRTEFLFAGRPDAPGEAEQAKEYAAIARILGPGRKLVVRTLDAGGDKPLPYLPAPREDNPFLGVRGLRISLRHEDLLRTQFRAILAAGGLCDLHVMLPMVSDVEELRSAKRIFNEEAQALGRNAKLGIMVEVPSAALCADVLAGESDFFSVGSNDLTQYCLAMDRGNPALARQADGLHPSVLKLIALTVESAKRQGRWTGVCGGIASDPVAVPLLIGLGVEELSVSVPAIAEIKALVSRLSKDRCEALAKEAMGLGSAPAVRALLAPFAEEESARA